MALVDLNQTPSATVVVTTGDDELRQVVTIVATTFGARVESLDLRTASRDAVRNGAVLAYVLEVTSFNQLDILRSRELIDAPVVVVADPNPALALAAIRHGAWDCTPSSADIETLVPVVRAAIQEGSRRQEVRSRIRDFNRRMGALSDNERAVLEAVFEGKRNKEIASEMNVSIRTIEERRRRVYDKMDVPSATQLARQVAEVQAIQEMWQMHPPVVMNPASATLSMDAWRGES